MDADPILEAEALLRDIWQQQGYVWPGPQIPPLFRSGYAHYAGAVAA